MLRDRFNQLPSTAELQDILAKETPRALPPGKETAHFFDFTPLVRLASYFQIDTSCIEVNVSPEELVSYNVFQRGRILIKELQQALLSDHVSDEAEELCLTTYDYLAEEDTLDTVDLIFVFGARTTARIEKAVELFKQGLARTILISGGGPHYAKDRSVSEAQQYAAYALARGIPASALLIEESSITIPDNVRSSLNLLDAQGLSYSSLIVVNSPYVQRRGYAHFKKYLPDTVRILRANSDTRQCYKRDVWYKSEVGIEVIVGEYLKATVAVTLNTA